MDTINAVSADNENLNSQFEEERLRRRERDSELIKIEETYDLEIRKLKRELDLSIQQCRQHSAKIQSVTENLQRAEERFLLRIHETIVTLFLSLMLHRQGLS